METASISHVCYANNIPFIAIRTITDTEEASGIEEFEGNLESCSIENTKVLKKVIEVICSKIDTF